MSFRFSHIPRVFHSAYSEQPFDRCISCQRELLGSDVPYIIQKQFVADEAVFEMSICVLCQEDRKSELSRESVQAMQSFVSRVEPRELAGVSQSETAAGLLGHCAFCAEPRRQCPRYVVTGVLLNDRIVVGLPQGSPLHVPVMVCDNCNREMNALLSRKTRDSWDRFVEDHFDGPPGIALPEDQPVPLNVC